MLFKKGNINKAISATLLLLLLFIHSVKLLHSHSGLLTGDVCKSNAFDLNEDSEKAASSDCSLCSYQLGKDIDEPVQFVINTPKQGPQLFTERQVFCFINSFSTDFDGRGPPRV